MLDVQNKTILITRPELPGFQGVIGMLGPGSSPRHFHHSMTVGVVDQGCRELVIGKNKALAHPGELFFIAPETGHRCGSAFFKPHRYRTLSFPIASTRGREFASGCGYDPHSKVLFEELFAALLEPASSLQQDHVQEYLQSIMSGLSECKGANCKMSTLHPCVQRALDLIKVHFQEPLSLAKISREACMSPAYLQRQFVADVGVSPQEFVLKMRVDCARRMLARGAPVSHIAHECGFSHQSHLTRYFKLLIGTTPGEFKKMRKAEN